MARSGEGGARPPLVCSWCKTFSGLAHEFVCQSMLDWQESIQVACRTCWKGFNKDATDRDFQQASNSSWKKRSANTKQLNRIKTWKEVVATTEKLDSESARAFHKRLVDAAAKLAAKWLAGFGLLPQAKREQILQAMDAFHEQGEKIVASPEYVPLLTSCQNVLDQSITQFLSTVGVDGVDEFYLCRTKGCGFYSIAGNWATCSDGTRTRDETIGRRGCS